MQKITLISSVLVLFSNTMFGASNTLDALSKMNPQELQKKAIVKLIAENEEMRSKIEALEERMLRLEGKTPSQVLGKVLSSNKTTSKLPVYFIPHILSTVREAPTSSSKHLLSLKSTSKSEVTEIKCKGVNTGYWGKIDIGWVYISNPDYGTLYDTKGNKISQDYNKWCEK